MLPVYKLGVLGDGGVGKTALISRFKSKMFAEEFDPTIEDSYTVDVVITGQECKLEILDTAGADSYIHLRDGWIRSNEGFILVYSISSKSSFIRIQGLYDEIQKVKKSSQPHTSSQVPIIIVGSKADMAKREVSLLEGKEMARILGCRFFESSAKDGGNIEKTFYTIMRQLQKLRKEKALLDDLIDSLPQWHNLVSNLESEISLSQIELAKANTSALAPVHAMNIATEQPGAKKPPTLQRFRVKLSTLHPPRLLQHQRSLPGINNCQLPSRPQSLLVLPKRKVSSVHCDISQPSEHPGRSVCEGNYNSEVQKAFGDINRFLSTLGGKVEGIARQARQARFAERMFRAAIDIEDNYIGGEVGSEIRDNEGTPTAAKVDEIDIAQVKKALDKCQKLCENAAFEVIRYGESRGKIQKMKDEFARMIEIAAKLR